MSGISGYSDNNGPAAVLAVLEAKPFFENRFMKQVKSLYPNTDSTNHPRLPAILYLQETFLKLPLKMKSEIYAATARQLVDRFKECPSPSELRSLVAECALQEANLTFDKLYERAKLFLALPPTQPEVAGRWIEKLIYTSTKHLTRDRFAVASPDEWARAVTDAMLSDTVPLLTYTIATNTVEAAAPTKHDFRSLIETKK